MNSDALAHIHRRTFIKQAGLLLGGAGLALQNGAAEQREVLRAAIIGHTGRGNYGHGLELIFNGVPNVEVVAVADPDAKGRAVAAQKSKAKRQYADYREMLAKEKPHLVSIAPRWSDQHHAMALAALKVGAHIFIEKPFTTALAEADEILALAKKNNLKIVVAHQMRYSPNIVHLKREIENGLIGELVQIRSWGKQDSRAGGEDMMVLGTHIFDMIRNFVGDPLSCTARIWHQGREFKKSDARKVGEDIGLIGADEIEAQFGFANGIFATFTSRAKLHETFGRWGIDLIGSKGTARILMDIFPDVYLLQRSGEKSDGKADSWIPLKDDPTLNFAPEQKGFGPANRRVVDDWLEAIRVNREPLCSGHAGMKAIEMVMAVYHAGLSGKRVAFPLVDRKHPLA
jgi:predicted dehydrogenase